MISEIPKDVLLRARLGDRDAFRIVVESTQRLAFNLAWRISRNGSDAEDAVQEIYLRLYRNFGRYDPEKPFLPWFRRLAVNCALNWREKQRPMSEVPELSVPPAEPRDPATRLQQAIRELPSEYQACVTLKYLEDLSIKEISQTLQIPPGTVKTWLFRAREILVRKLKPHVDALL